MTSFAVRATSVKNNNDMDKISDIRFTLLKLPNTNVFTADDVTSDSGVCFYCSLAMRKFCLRNK